MLNTRANFIAIMTFQILAAITFSVGFWTTFHEGNPVVSAGAFIGSGLLAIASAIQSKTAGGNPACWNG